MPDPSEGPSADTAETTSAITADLCSAALSLLVRGEWQQAIALLRQAIADHPTSADLWLELGNTWMERACLSEATDAYERAIAIDASISEAHANLAMAYREQGRFEEAIAACQRCVALDPGDAEGLVDLGLLLQEQERFDQALEAFRRASALQPSPGLLARMGDLLVRREDLEGAVGHYRQALALVPSAAEPADAEMVEIFSRLGVALHRQGQLEEAIEAYGKALAQRPDLHEVNTHRAMAIEQLRERQQSQEAARALALAREGKHAEAEALLAGLRTSGPPTAALCSTQAALQSLAGRHEEALALLDNALGQWLDHPELLNALGVVLGRLERTREAIGAFRAALRQDPARVPVLANLGKALLRAEEVEEALTTLNKALSLSPEDPELRLLIAMAEEDRDPYPDGQRVLLEALHLKLRDPQLLSTLGWRLIHRGLLEEALHAFEQAHRLTPNDPTLTMQLATAYLRRERFEEGWPLYEERWRYQASAASQDVSTCASLLPRWQPGMSCDRLLLLGEQGLGDQIMVASMLEEITGWAPHLALMADPRLRPLFERSFPHLQFVAIGQGCDPAAFQAHLPMASLAAHLRQRKEHFLAHRRPYLLADPDRTRTLRRRHSTGGVLVCGIAWRSTNPDVGDRKSIHLQRLATTLALPRVRLLSLQYGDTRRDIEELRRATGIEVAEDPEVDTTNDIDGLASLISACDLVISTSNTAVNLAGALGQHTWVLFDPLADWRWGTEDGESLWYPEVRLFSQRQAGDWEGVLQAVRGELEGLLERRGNGDAAETLIKTGPDQAAAVIQEANLLSGTSSAEASPETVRAEPAPAEIKRWRF